MPLKRVVLLLALTTGCAWNGAPPVIKAANAVGWAAVPAGIAIAYAAPNECRTDPQFPGAMECGRSTADLTIGVGLVALGLLTVFFTHTGFK